MTAVEPAATDTAAAGQGGRTWRPRRRTGLARADARVAYFLITPAVLVVVALVIFPFLWNAALSLQRVRLIDLRSVDFLTTDVTTRNFGRVTGTRDFWTVIKTTFIYTIVGTTLSIAMGLWAALIMQKAFRGRTMVRGLMLFPYVAPVIAVAFAWKMMLNPTFGIANEWQSNLGLPRVDYLGRRDFVLGLGPWHLTLPLALGAVILFEGWRYFPFAYLFLLARIQAIPEDLNEAALVDGATISQRFVYVTLPQLRPVLAVLFLLRFIFTFNKFDDVFLLTGGAAGTQVVSTKVIDWLLGRADVGSAAALSLVLAGFLVLFVIVYFAIGAGKDTSQ